jgi:hypothetical protein
MSWALVGTEGPADTLLVSALSATPKRSPQETQPDQYR